ncbi:SDR family oxidoreductase [Longimicrobium sp.]|uniref:SDR family oxidoreductase n=1 Tax=Longimicrobium sp. TaxID=2029185 RepID=UPI003B3AA94C
MIAVTGSTGHFGRIVIENLLERGIAPDHIVALARNPEKAAGFAARGVQVRQADYEKPETLVAALQGVEKLLFVSGSEAGQRIPQHQNVVDAAKQAGVRLIAYTSIANAGTSGLQLAVEHKATEEMIRQSGIPFVFLRNNWYLENYTGNLASTVEHGVLLGSADEGRLSAATRADLAIAAGAVSAGEGHEGKIYELGGDVAFTMPELAEVISRESGRPVEYRNLPEDAYAQALAGFGLPEAFARILADSDRGIARGDLFTDSGDLSRLLGRPTTTPAEAVGAALRV